MELLDKNISELLKTFIEEQYNKKELRYYDGKVVDVNDPLRQGRCKIRVYGIYGENIPDFDLPWAEMEQSFLGSLKGNFIVPPINSLVKVTFEKDDYNLPRYTSKIIHKNSLTFSSNIEEDYPNSIVFFETDVGEYFKINRSTNVSTYRHASGLIIRIESDGSCYIDSDGTDIGNFNITIGGNVSLKSSGNIDIKSDKKISLEGSLGIDIKSDLNITAKSSSGFILLGDGTSPVSNIPTTATPSPGSPIILSTPSSALPGKGVFVSS